MAFGKNAVDFEMRVNFDRLRSERLQKAKDQIKEAGLGAVVTWDADTIRYIASHYITTPLRAGQMQFVVLPRNGEPILFTASTVYKIQERMPWLKPENIRPALRHTKYMRSVEEFNRHVEVLGEILAAHGVTKEPLGLDGLSSELMLAEALKKIGVSCVDAKAIMLDARAIKTRDEVEIMKQACQNTDQVFAALKDAIRPGIRECDLVGLAMKHLYELGVDHTEDIVCCSGPNSNPFDPTFTDRPIESGDLIYIDIDSASYLGYKPCVYRTFSCGKATQEQKDLYEEARAMLYDGMSAVKAGNYNKDICEKWPTSASYWGYETWEEVLPYAVGHGIGLSLHEIPFVSLEDSREHPRKLEENMVIALETWTGKKGGKDGVRLEQCMVVT